MRIKEYLETELCKPSIFINEEVLAPSYIPSKILHRDNEIKTLFQQYRNIISESGKYIRPTLVYGPPGVGKTTIVSIISRELQKIASKRGTKVFVTHLNGGFHRTQYQVFLEIARTLSPSTPSRGYSTEDLLLMTKEVLTSLNAYMFVIFDEFEKFSRINGVDILHSLTRLFEPGQANESRLALTVINTNYSFLEQLDESTASTFNPTKIHFSAYPSNELYEILISRCKDAFQEGSVPEESLKMIADACEYSGDARMAIQILLTAGKLADRNNSTWIRPNYIRKVLSKLEQTISRSVLSKLSFHELLIILGICRELKFSNQVHLTTGEAYESYGICCEEFDKKQLKHTQFWKSLRIISAMEIVQLSISGSGHRGRTSLISITAIDLDDLESELVIAINKELKK